MNEKQKIKQFTEKFFSKLGCSLQWDNEVLKVENVPKDFETFYGKPSPYQLFFDSKSEKEIESSKGEFVTKGSYILNAMNKYLENKGSTSLLKINFDFNPEEIIKNNFSLKNCEISKINTKTRYESIVRFTFLTIFQYLNEKEETINHIYLKNGEIINFDISNYQTEEGNKREVKTSDLRKEYEKSKQQLKFLLEDKTRSLKKKLNKKLNKELSRIEKHHQEQLKDRNSNIHELKKQLERLNKKFNQSEDIFDSQKLDERIKKTKQQIQELESEKEIERLKKEKQSSIKEENNKHAINLKNKLMNTSLIYFPIYNFQIYLKSRERKTATKIIDLTYNPLKEEISGVYCQGCQKQVKEIILCSSGHLTCRECGDRCSDCNNIVCKKCKTNKCQYCGKLLCQRCVSNCSSCKKNFCKKHLLKDQLTGEIICNLCSKVCSGCGKQLHPKNLRTDKSNGKDYCERCIHKEIKKKTLGDIFNE